LAQSSPRFCSQCGSTVEAGQRFCTNCGATTNIESNAATALATGDQTALASDQVQSTSPVASTAAAASSDALDSSVITPASDTTVSTVIDSSSTPGAPATPASGATPSTLSSLTPNVSGTPYSKASTSGDQFYAQTTDADVIPPPPPPDSFISTPLQTPAPPYYTPPSPEYTSVPSYARAPKRSKGCLITSIVLLLVLVLGGIGAYFAFRPHGTNGGNQSGNNANGQQTTPGASGNTPVSSASTPGRGSPTSSGPVTQQLNLMFTYASIVMTITSVQEANSFPDDNSATQGVVRISLNEKNSTPHSGSFLYSDAARLVLPDGTTATSDNAQHNIGPDSSTSRTNWIDFAVPSSNLDLSKLILRMGKATENQMDIPLIPNADLSKYQPKTVTPNTTFQYAGLNWTITSATKSLSANDQQATAGNVYITVTLKVDNPTSSDFNGYWGDYIRLKSGNTTSAPTTDTTLPLNFAAGSTGSTGNVFFVMPQGSTSFTLMMLTRPTSPPINAASTTFQIQ
jgi:zinc ribbon protein